MAERDRDFFISYTGVDRAWAEWIAWQLEDAGFVVVLQEWDFRPGSNFILEMDRAAKDAKRTIAVLSPDYLKASFTQPEWGGAVALDPKGLSRTLVPIRVRECQPTGLLGQIVYIDLVGYDENAAREKLIAGLRDRGKPDRAPVFPGAAEHADMAEPSFPGPDAESFSDQRDHVGGTWVKVGDVCFEAEAVDDTGTTIMVSGQFEEDLSRRLERLRASEFGRNRVRVVHGDRVVDGDVQRVRRSSHGGRSRVELEFDRVEPVRGGAMRAGTGGLSPDDLVEVGLRHLLLGEPLPSSLGMLSSMANPEVDAVSLRRALALPIEQARQIVRLIITEGLLSNGNAAAVTRLEIDDTPEGRRIILEWEEPRDYANVEPGQRRVEGFLEAYGRAGLVRIQSVGSGTNSSRRNISFT